MRPHSPLSAQLPSDPLLARIRGEYLEMPGLRLTFSQARRLWQLDPAICHAYLQTLVNEGFLGRTPDGAFVVASAPTEPCSTAPSPVDAPGLGTLILRPAPDRRKQPRPTREGMDAAS